MKITIRDWFWCIFVIALCIAWYMDSNSVTYHPYANGGSQVR